MNLLFDENLLRRLVGQLAAEYPGSEHVAGAGLLGADTGGGGLVACAAGGRSAVRRAPNSGVVGVAVAPAAQANHGGESRGQTPF
jgi:hypothetical protein